MAGRDGVALPPRLYSHCQDNIGFILALHSGSFRTFSCCAEAAVRGGYPHGVVRVLLRQAGLDTAKLAVCPFCYYGVQNVDDKNRI